MNQKKYMIFFFLFLKLVSPIYSWWSVPPFGSTHYYLSDEAKKLITAIEYPDITTRFGNDICAWTDGSTDDASAHNDYIDNNGEDGKKNDGAIKVHWEKGFDKYKNFKFSSNDEDAYYYFGLMTHLVEDMAVPAHAYDIQHGNFGNMDNVEQLVDGYIYDISPSSSIVSASGPFSNRDALRNHTINKLSDSYWRKYWITFSSPHHVTLSGQTYTFYGYYNGSDSEDVFPFTWYHIPLLGTGCDTMEKSLIRDLVGCAIGYPAGGLIEISKNLPPLIKDIVSGDKNKFDIALTSEAEPIINPVLGNDMTFRALENRKKEVYVYLNLDSITGDIIKANYNGNDYNFNGKQIDLLQSPSGDDHLPWEKDLTINWKGKLANGSDPSEGKHKVYLRLKDDDKNFHHRQYDDRNNLDDAEVPLHSVLIDNYLPFMMRPKIVSACVYDSLQRCGITTFC